MAASPRQWVTIVAACAVFSLVLHMGMYTSNQHGGSSGGTHIYRPSSVNDSAPLWATHLSDNVAKAHHDITKL
jgi:hypothetical protein